MTPIAWAKLAGFVGVLLLAGWIGRQTMAGENAALRIKHADTLTEIARDAAEVARQAKETGEKFRQAEYAQAEAFNVIAGTYEKESTDAVESAKARVLADVHAGRVRVRLPWRAPVSCAPQAPAGAGQPDAAADSGAGLVAAAVGIGAACDAQVKGLQAVLIEERK